MIHNSGILRRSARNRRAAGLVPAALLLLLATASAHAQTVQDPDEPLGIRWLHAGAAIELAGISFADDDAERRMAVRLEIGGRLRGPWGTPGWLHVTPKAGIATTSLRGLADGSDGFAYAGLDLAGRVTAARHARVRPFGEAGWGFKQTAEMRAPDGRMLNYAGKGTRFALGIELPRTREERGFEIGISLTRGRYTTAEFQRNWEDVDLRHRAVSVFAGWSGRFTGISLPWQ